MAKRKLRNQSGQIMKKRKPQATAKKKAHTHTHTHTTHTHTHTHTHREPSLFVISVNTSLLFGTV